MSILHAVDAKEKVTGKQNPALTKKEEDNLNCLFSS